jgi:Universal stress protein UspA and related nucleotide-binding proteins
MSGLRVLAPVDFSDGSREAVERGISILGEIAVLHLVYVTPLGLRELDDFVEEDYVQRAKGIAEGKMAEFIGSLSAGAAREVRYTVAAGDPASIVVEMANSGEFDVVLMAHRGYSYIEDFFIGSVTLKVISKSRIPVVVVRKEVPGR